MAAQDHGQLRAWFGAQHVLLHQTIIGEALLQLAKIGESVDLIVGCTGGGSNSRAHLPLPAREARVRRRSGDPRRGARFLPEPDPGHLRLRLRRRRGPDPDAQDAHPGHDFIPDPIHAGGLRYHGMSPLISHLYEENLIEAVAKTRRTASRRRPLRPYRGHRAGA